MSGGIPVPLGVNKKNELVRLLFEICRGRGLGLADVIEWAGIGGLVEGGRGGLFHRVKEALLDLRYPSAGVDGDPRIMPLKMDAAREECPVWDLELEPGRVFVERSVRRLEWTESFTRNFPGAEIVEMDDLRDVVGGICAGDKVSVYNSRRDRVFLVRARSGFVKMCPCTKGYKRCGYWILNIGFGCPIDCSYCYLQMYSNAPGLILPANIEDYYEHVERFDRQLTGRTRIGTGEFTDSLALDRYTGYSRRLIPFFRKTRNLVLELKTKSGDIDNVLAEEPHENVVISWSMNTRKIAEKYEKGGASVSERIDAASRAAKRGYRVGFHFDPVVYYKGWEDEYKAVIEEMFSVDEIKRNVAWISLGTLRYAPGFKRVAEQRFAENRMFYEGEFFVDTDGKLRYPRPLRAEMYNKMAGWIRSSGVSCRVYLCMEPGEVWREIRFGEDDG